MEASIQHAFGKSIGEVVRDVADFLSTPFVIGKEHPVELCSLVAELNMHAQFSFALLSEARAQGWEPHKAEAFYRRACAPLIDDAITEQMIAAFRAPEGAAFRTLDQKYGNRFQALDGSYWATVLSVAIDADEVERVLSYLHRFTLTLLEFAYMEERNPDSTYAWGYHEAFGRALASFAVPDTAPLPLTVSGIGGTKGNITDRGYLLTLAADIKNPNPDKMARGVAVNILLKDRDGATVATVGDRIQCIDPDTVYHYAITKRITGAPFHRIAVSATADSYLPLSAPIMHHVALCEVKVDVEHGETRLSATLKNNYPTSIGGITLHYQYRGENGKAKGGAALWIPEAPPPGEEAPISSRIPLSIGGIADLCCSADFDAHSILKGDFFHEN